MNMHVALRSGAARSLAIGAVALVLSTPTPGRAAQAQAADADRDPGASEYVIGSGDVLDVVVWNNTPLSRAVAVRPDGKISLPLVNDVQAAGTTPMQLRAILTKGLESYISEPEVSVIVKEFHSIRISVIGQVKTAGRFELTSHATVLDVLAMAGGLNEYADRGRIVVLRRQGASTKQIPFAYEKLTAQNGSAGRGNFFVQPDDIIFVP
jgi:polysaccharide biosynthesis/export protein